MNEKLLYTFEVNGFTQESFYYRDTVETVFLPLLRKWSEMQRRKNGRLIVFLAAPPACGKSTVAHFLKYLSETAEDVPPIQIVGIDGFHYHQEYIAAHTVTYKGVTRPMRDVKGSPETYDLDKLNDKLRALTEEKTVLLPEYSRAIHDPIEDHVAITADIVLVEGNWLLYPELGWQEMQKFCDYSLFVTAEESLLRQRLIDRKVRGGVPLERVLAIYENGDGANIRRCLAHRLPADLELSMTEDGNYILAPRP